MLVKVFKMEMKIFAIAEIRTQTLTIFFVL